LAAFSGFVVLYNVMVMRGSDGNPASHATDVVPDYLILLWPENKYNQISFKPN
jgi:hypothetical protein